MTLILAAGGSRAGTPGVGAADGFRDNLILDQWSIPFGSWIDQMVDWTDMNLEWLLDAIKWPFEFLIDAFIGDFLIAPWMSWLYVVLGITIIGSLSQGSIVSGLLSGIMGLLLSTVGMDLITGTPRMTFGNINLFSGIEFTVALIGLFSIPQALILIENAHDSDKVASKITDRLVPRLKELRTLMPNILRSGGIGIVTVLSGGNFLDYGALPLPMDPVQIRVIGTLGIETGVMIGVTGVMVLIFDVLAPWDDGTI